MASTYSAITTTGSITIEVRNGPLMQVETLAHELAHAILHSETTLPRERTDLEAESVAYIVCADLGIDSAGRIRVQAQTWVDNRRSV